MSKKKKIILCLIAAAAVLGIGMTMALLSFTTNTKVNAFSSSKNIAIRLREPNWDGYDFNDSTDPDGTKVNPNYSGDATQLGLKQARSYQPGQVINKNPTVMNIGTEVNKSVPCYVALKVQYYNVTKNGNTTTETQISYDDFKSNYLTDGGIVFDTTATTGWTLIGSKTGQDQVYKYNSILQNSQTTSPLFKTVPLKSTIAVDPSTGQLPKFKIKVTAYAVQSANVTDSTSALLDFMGYSN